MSATDLVNELVTIPALKIAARKHYMAYMDAVGNMSCGKTLAEHVSTTVATHKAAFNSTMDKLAKIDPNCPARRL